MKKQDNGFEWKTIHFEKWIVKQFEIVRCQELEQMCMELKMLPAKVPARVIMTSHVEDNYAITALLFKPSQY